MTTKELAEAIHLKAFNLDELLKRADVSTDVKFYFFGVFMMEISQICKDALSS